MKIKERKIAELNPAEYNPRQLTDKQYKQLKKSLKTFGCVEPVVIIQILCVRMLLLEGISVVRFGLT